MAVVAAFVLSGCILSQTGAPRIVADASAQLTGTVRSSQPDAATYWFEYGTTPTYGASTATTSAFLQQGANTVSVWVDTLTAGTTYHYRLCSDVADTLPPNCGSDQVLTTTTGHDAVHGEATSAYQQFCPVAPSFICTYSDSVSIAAAGDPTAGTVEGEVGLNGVVPGTLMSGPLGYGGTGTIRCLRVSGNIAVVGYSYVINSDVAPPVSGDQGLVIEDNGTTGDRYLATTPWSPITACPAPSASLFDAGTPHPGNFVVHGRARARVGPIYHPDADQSSSDPVARQPIRSAVASGDRRVLRVHQRSRRDASRHGIRGVRRRRLTCPHSSSLVRPGRRLTVVNGTPSSARHLATPPVVAAALRLGAEVEVVVFGEPVVA